MDTTPTTSQADAPAGYTEEDLAYLRAEYTTLERLCAGRAEDPDGVRRLIEDGRLPRAAYTLPDGTELFWPDYFDLVDSAGGPDGLRAHFEDRHRAATSALGLADVGPEDDWRGYLSGEYGARLREVTPEAMVEKALLIAEIDALVAVPATEDDAWRRKLRDAVDELDDLERPTTDHDRRRFGTTSRDTHITALRMRYLGEQ
jgi:hypothetical protein